MSHSMHWLLGLTCTGQNIRRDMCWLLVVTRLGGLWDETCYVLVVGGNNYGRQAGGVVTTAYAPDTAIDFLLLRHQPRYDFYTHLFNALQGASSALLSNAVLCVWHSKRHWRSRVHLRVDCALGYRGACRTFVCVFLRVNLCDGEFQMKTGLEHPSDERIRRCFRKAWVIQSRTQHWVAYYFGLCHCVAQRSPNQRLCNRKVSFVSCGIWVICRARVQILNNSQTHIDYIDKIEIADNTTAHLDCHVTHLLRSNETTCVVSSNHRACGTNVDFQIFKSGLFTHQLICCSSVCCGGFLRTSMSCALYPRFIRETTCIDILQIHSLIGHRLVFCVRHMWNWSARRSTGNTAHCSICINHVVTMWG